METLYSAGLSKIPPTSPLPARYGHAHVVSHRSELIKALSFSTTMF